MSQENRHVVEDLPVNVVWRVGRRVYVRSPKGSGLDGACKAIGMHWDPQQRARWCSTAKLDEVVAALRDHPQDVAAHEDEARLRAARDEDEARLRAARDRDALRQSTHTLSLGARFAPVMRAHGGLWDPDERVWRLRDEDTRHAARAAVADIEARSLPVADYTSSEGDVLTSHGAIRDDRRWWVLPTREAVEQAVSAVAEHRAAKVDELVAQAAQGRELDGSRVTVTGADADRIHDAHQQMAPGQVIWVGDREHVVVQASSQWLDEETAGSIAGLIPVAQRYRTVTLQPLVTSAARIAERDAALQESARQAEQARLADQAEDEARRASEDAAREAARTQWLHDAQAAVEAAGRTAVSPDTSPQFLTRSDLAGLLPGQRPRPGDLIEVPGDVAGVPAARILVTGPDPDGDMCGVQVQPTAAESARDDEITRARQDNAARTVTLQLLSQPGASSRYTPTHATLTVGDDKLAATPKEREYEVHGSVGAVEVVCSERARRTGRVSRASDSAQVRITGDPSNTVVMSAGMLKVQITGVTTL